MIQIITLSQFFSINDRYSYNFTVIIPLVLRQYGLYNQRFNREELRMLSEVKLRELLEEREE
jgi:hypothetical protein